MFTILHELAKKATLMITIAPEGDDQLRVNVTPVPFDTKAKANLPQPLSLLATPTEFDADFIAALSTWQAPKRSLIQQAQDAAGGAAPAAAPALPAPKSESKAEKPARKARGSKSGDSEQKPDAAQAVSEAAADDQVASEQPGADEQLPVSGESGSSASENPVLDQGSQQDAGEAAGAAAGAADVAEPVANAAAGQDVATAPVVAAEEPVDKFTLDLF